MRVPWRRRAPAPPLRTVRHVAPAPPPPAAADLSELEALARYHRDRVALYRARMHGSQPTSVSHLEGLERASTTADERLRTARRLARG